MFGKLLTFKTFYKNLDFIINFIVILVNLLSFLQLTCFSEILYKYLHNLFFLEIFCYFKITC